jgi:hypothetical protein
MNKLGMTMLGMDQEILTPEFARDYIRPFYEEVFERLRKFISDEKALPSPLISPLASKHVVSDQSLEDKRSPRIG